MRIANLAVATSESWRDKMSGERKERTEWHRVVIFNERLAEIAEKYLKKGSKVYLEGALQSRKWTDNSGQERYTTEIVLNRFRGELTMLDGAGGARGAGGPPQARAAMTRVMPAAASATSRRQLLRRPGPRPHPGQRSRRRHSVLDLVGLAHRQDTAMGRFRRRFSLLRRRGPGS